LRGLPGDLESERLLFLAGEEDEFDRDLESDRDRDFLRGDGRLLGGERDLLGDRRGDLRSGERERDRERLGGGLRHRGGRPLPLPPLPRHGGLPRRGGECLQLWRILGGRGGIVNSTLMSAPSI